MNRAITRAISLSTITSSSLFSITKSFQPRLVSQSSSSSVELFKFSDDSTLVGFISKNDESFYFDEVSKLVEWCDSNSLELNVCKTKEMAIDFRINKSSIEPLVIKGQAVDTVDTFKFLGSTISNDLKWESNTSCIINKCHQRLHFLRKIKKFGVGQATLVNFYRASIESILTFSITSWYTSLSAADMNKLDRIVFIASKVIGTDLTSVDTLYHQRATKKVKTIIANADHPAHSLFKVGFSGKRFRSIPTKKERFTKSFYPSAVRESCPHQRSLCSQ